MCDRGHLATHPHRNTREKIFTSSVLRLSVFSKHPWANCLVSSATQDVAAEGATSKHRDGWQNPNGNPARPLPVHRINRGFFFGGQGAQPCLMWRKAEKARCSFSVSAWPCAARHIIPEQFQPTGELPCEGLALLRAAAVSPTRCETLARAHRAAGVALPGQGPSLL